MLGDGGLAVVKSYAEAKGRAPSASLKPLNQPPPHELSDAEREQVAENIAFVKAHLPELVPFVKDLHAEGLIDGWRAVRHCRLLKGVEHGAG